MYCAGILTIPLPSHAHAWYRPSMDWWHIIDVLYVLLGLVIGRGSNHVIKPRTKKQR